MLILQLGGDQKAEESDVVAVREKEKLQIMDTVNKGKAH